ncbi:MAG TPA: hypothetical protein VGJ86_16930 [Acidimicrobiales bacterium]|jgi:hypothetical protein
MQGEDGESTGRAALLPSAAARLIVLVLIALIAWWYWTATASADAQSDETADTADAAVTATSTTTGSGGVGATDEAKLDVGAVTDWVGDDVFAPVLDTVSPGVIHLVVRAVSSDLKAVDILVEAVDAQVASVDEFVQSVTVILDGAVLPASPAGPDLSERRPLSSDAELAEAGLRAGSAVPQLVETTPGPAAVAFAGKDGGRTLAPVGDQGNSGGVTLGTATGVSSDAGPDEGPAALPSSSSRSTAVPVPGGGERIERGPVFSAVIASHAASAAAMTTRATPIVVVLVDGLGSRPPTTPD